MNPLRRLVLNGLLASLVSNPALAERAADAHFGLGPRVSESGLYTATLQPTQALRLRQLHTVPVLVLDRNGRPVEDATITVDGGMPEHSHGLPTKPQVRRALGGGVYEIEGLRFSMGGWWEVKLSITSPAGRDRVTFNLAL
jgi:hypothetical protein